MNIRSVLIPAALLALAIASPVLAAPSTKEFAVAINQSGRQRMLSQKMSKEFTLICLQLDPAANRTELAKTIKLFDTTLARLQKGDADVSMPAPPTPEIAAQLELVKGIWSPFRAAVETALAPNPVPADTQHLVAKESLHLVVEMDKAVTLYENACIAAGIQGTGSVVNVAGRQRMLSQRMSKDIFFIALAVDPDTARADLRKVRDLFDRSLHGLTDGDEVLHLPPTTNKTIRAQLATVAEIWGRFSALVDRVLIETAAPAPDLLREVAELNPKLLAECQKVVGSYETATY